jgi:hypothetical protein
VVAHPLMEQSWDNNSYEKWINFQAAQSINKQYA